MAGTRGDLTVRINDGRADRHVTKHVSGLRFTKVSPGGHQSCSYGLNLPRGTFDDLGPQDKTFIHDARTGKTIFGAGYIENPTPVDGPSGQAFDISAVGGMALASDETRPLIYVTKELGDFETDPTSYSGVSEGTQPTGKRVQISGGSPIVSTAFGAIRNRVMELAGMDIGAFTFDCYGGKIDANWGPGVSTDGGYSAYVGAGTSGSLSTSHQGTTRWVGTHFTNSARLTLFLQRIGATTNVADDTTWAQWDAFAMIGQRMDRHGTLLTGSAGLVSPDSVRAHQVIEDLLGRLLTFCDPATAVVDATTFEIDQLAFPEGVKAAAVLDQLDLWEPDHTWEIGETLPNGLHRFAYYAWPTTPRYVVSVADGWRQTGGDVDLCNRIAVSWTDATGTTQTTVVTADDLGLTGIGLPIDALGTRVKDADPITLPDGLGSEANAIAMGSAILRDKINPPRAGTVTVRRPIVDMLTGNEVMPWELEPGCVVQVQETGDQLRCTQMDYSDDDVAATLTLGQPRLTSEQRLARLAAA